MDEPVGFSQSALQFDKHRRYDVSLRVPVLSLGSLGGPFGFFPEMKVVPVFCLPSPAAAAGNGATSDSSGAAAAAPARCSAALRLVGAPGPTLSAWHAIAARKSAAAQRRSMVSGGGAGCG